ncbi:MAG: glycosyltransferase, partial [Actinomycetota bacterium]
MANRRNVVSIAFMLPYQGVDHAGGEFLLRHYRVLADRCSGVTAFGPDFETNLTAVERGIGSDFPSYHAEVVRFPRWRKTLLGKIIARFFFITVPVLPDIGAVASCWVSESLRDRLRTADIVELQWFEYFYFARLVRRVNPSAEIVAVNHDVPSQRIERSLANWPAPLRRMYIAYVAWLECRLLSGIELVAALSLKDAELLKHRTSVPVTVLHPPIDFDRSAQSAIEAGRIPPNADGSFGFVGALHRRENDDAARWLLSEIWPAVIERSPTASLYIVGSKPSEELQAAASRFPDSVTLTGYVEDIDSFYDKFSTAVIPLRYGAGIKFKTVSAVLARKNVVATPIAVEGTLPDD